MQVAEGDIGVFTGRCHRRGAADSRLAVIGLQWHGDCLSCKTTGPGSDSNAKQQTMNSWETGPENEFIDNAEGSFRPTSGQAVRSAFISSRGSLR